MSQINEKLIANLANAGLSSKQITEILVAAAGSSSVANTSTSVAKPDFGSVDMRGTIAKASKAFQAEEKVAIRIAPPYGKMVGGFMKVSVNGVGVELPCDGIEYKIPKTLADAFLQRMKNLDAIDSAQGFKLSSDEISASAAKAGLKTGNHLIATETYK